MTLPVVILAGGMATRLGAVTRGTPKSLVEVAGKPFAVHQLELLRRNGVTQVFFCVGHLGEKIESALGPGGEHGIHIQYVFDGPALLGTGGALRKALPFLPETFFVLYGDSYLDCDYFEIQEAFWASRKPALMTLFRNADQWDRSNVVFDNGSIRKYDKNVRTPDMHYIDYGLSIFRARILNRYPEDMPLDLSAIYQELISQTELAGFEVRNRFYEIGSSSGLDETRAFLEKR